MEYKNLTEAQMKDMGITVEDRRHYLKVMFKFTHGHEKVSFNDVVRLKESSPTSHALLTHEFPQQGR